MEKGFTLIDLSHTIEAGMTTYKGLPAPVITDYLSREQSSKHFAEGTQFQIGKIEMVANTGTYLDSPFHRYDDGRDLSELELASLANLDAVVVNLIDQQAMIDRLYFDNLDVRGKAVLIRTGWDAHWRTERYWSGEHPYLTRDAATSLCEGGAAIVGIDSYNIDSTQDGSRPAHSVLLVNNIPIVEHLCHLDRLPATGFKFFAVPVKVRRFGTFPVRAFAIVPNGA